MSDSSDATSWTQKAKLTADDGAANRIISVISVAISDGTIVVGAHLGTTMKGQILVPRTSSRRAILPTRPRGRKRRNSPPKTEQCMIDYFGFSLAISDGTIVVGAP